MAFEGFSKEGANSLANLGNKDKAWFDANRTLYKAEVAEPAKEFVEAMGRYLNDNMSPDIVAIPKTNGSIAPINNDLRFNPDASPYKDHLMFRFWEGPNKKTAAMLMLRVHPVDGVGVATGIGFSDLTRWRELVDSDAGEDLEKAIKTLVKKTGAEVVGEGLKKVPKPYDQDHPRGDLLRHKGLQIRWIPKSKTPINSAKLVDWCGKELAKTSEVHNWLVDYLV
jgi:uncharacterized protein (TIGR02453 family)